MFNDNAMRRKQQELELAWLNATAVSGGVANEPPPPPPSSFFDLYPGHHHHHVVSLAKSSPPSNQFDFYGDGVLFGGDKWVSDDIDDNNDVGFGSVHLLSKDFSGMSILEEQVMMNNHHGAKTTTRGVVPMAMPSSYTPYGLEEPPNPLFHQRNVAATKSSTTWGGGGGSVSQGLVSDVNWSLPSSSKGSAFDSLCYGNSDCCGGDCYGGGGGGGGGGYAAAARVAQFQKPSFAASPSPSPPPHHYAYDHFLCSPRRSSFESQQPKIGLNLNNARPSSRCFPATRESPNWEQQQCPQSLPPGRTGFDPVAFRCDNSFIIQGKDMRSRCENGCNGSPVCGSGRKHSYSHSQSHSHRVVGEEVPLPLPQVVVSPRVPICHHGNSSSVAAGDVTQPLLVNFGSVAELQAYMYHMAKDQNGCRFLQTMVEDGTPEDVQIVFEGVRDVVVELMMDPFGNYLVQKLVEFCRDDQRLQIVLMLTKEPGQLVRTSLNTHGTRVVQKLIGSLRSRQQISLVRSAIQPSFLDLVKDLNGNHVVQRCLQCLNNQENEFIFDAAVKFCVDMATHQHGCCVLQRCIDTSTGKCHDKIIKEICKHALLLAQDPYGNYVVQYIIDLENPSITAKLISMFKGNYINLATQKFSSHVVEKCLNEVIESRSRIVQELLSATHFEQLLQDPYANYVIQCALSVTKGPLHASLVEAVRPHKILRTSPYCKRIFSRNLLKK